MSDDRVDSFGLGVLLSASLNVLLGDSPLGQVDVSLVFVHSDDHHWLCSPHSYQFVDRPETDCQHQHDREILINKPDTPP